MSTDIFRTLASGIELCARLYQTAAGYNEQTEDLKNIGETISDRVGHAEDCLKAVQEIPCVRTPAVDTSIGSVNEALQMLADFHEKLVGESESKAVKLWYRIAPNGKLQMKYKTKLERLLDKLSSSIASLQVSISTAPAGIVGNYEDGFFVPYKFLEGANQKVYIRTGHNLKVREILKGRTPQSDGMIAITESDLRAIEEVTKMKLTETPLTGQDEAVVVSGNIGDQRWDVLTGNMGVESNNNGEMYKVKVANNQVREGGSVVTGHMTAEVATQLLAKVFK